MYRLVAMTPFKTSTDITIHPHFEPKYTKSIGGTGISTAIIPDIHSKKITAYPYGRRYGTYQVSKQNK